MRLKQGLSDKYLVLFIINIMKLSDSNEISIIIYYAVKRGPL